MRQPRRQRRGQLLRVEGAAGVGQHIGDEHLLPGGCGAAEGDGEGDVRAVAQRGVDLAEFDAEAADLDLEVGAAEIFDGHRTGGMARVADTPAGDIAGAVHARAGRAEGVGDEAGRGQAGPVVIAAGDAGAGDVQLPGDPGRHRVQPTVEDQLVDAAHRMADGDGLPRHQHVGDVADDGGLGGTVRVVHPPPRCPARHQFRRARLTRDGDRLALDAGRVHRRQRGRGGEQVGDPFAAQQRGQFVAAVDVGGHHHQGRADAEGGHVLEDRRVEARRGRNARPAPPGAGPGGCAGSPTGSPGRGADHHALGAAGGAGGVDQVGGMVEQQRARPVVVGDRLITGLRDPCVEIRIVEDEPGHRAGQLVAVRGGGQAQDRPGVGEHVLDAFGRIFRVDGHEGGPGLGDRQITATDSRERAMPTATKVSGPAPASMRTRASRLDQVSSSP